MVLQIQCKGSPDEIGFQHGSQAAAQIEGSIDFYAALFKKYTGNGWEDVLPIASQFEANIRNKWPRYFEEMEGVARGSNRDVLDIIALNVRTEIMFGLLKDRAISDGCTSVAWKSGGESFLAQNWDWMEEQRDNLVLITITPDDDLPTIKIITEAGIIGKIGLNSAGVGVCLNAVRSRGYDASRLPVHLGLRMALESTSAAEAASRLESQGMAGSAHILVADKDGSIGLEFTSKTFIRLNMDSCGQVLHSNHMIEQHEGIDELAEPDSFARLKRIKLLAAETEKSLIQLSWETVSSLIHDHDGFPESICRFQEGVSYDATLFSIIMELNQRKARLIVGKQCCNGEEFTLTFP